MSNLKKQFLAAYSSADSISVDGNFCRHYDNTVNQTSSHSGIVIDLEFDAGDDELVNFVVLNEHLDELSVNENGEWTVGDYSVEFYKVTTILPSLE